MHFHNVSRAVVPILLLLQGGCISLVGTAVDGGAALSISARAVDAEFDNGLAEVSLILSVVEDERTVVDERMLTESCEDGVLRYDGVVRWGTIMGPLERRRLDPYNGILSLTLSRPGYETKTFEYPLSSVLSTSDKPFEIDLETVTLERLKPN